MSVHDFATKFNGSLLSEMAEIVANELMVVVGLNGHDSRSRKLLQSTEYRYNLFILLLLFLYF